MNNIIVGMGEALWDVLPEGKKIGGAPANFAYHVSQFGFDSRVVSAVGREFEIILRRNALAAYRDVTGEVAEHLATLGHFIVHAVLFNVNQPLGGSAIRYSTCPPHNSAGIGLTQETMELLRPFQATGHGSIITFRRIADFGQPHGNSLRFGFAERFNGRIFPGHRKRRELHGRRVRRQ